METFIAGVAIGATAWALVGERGIRALARALATII